MIFAYIAYFFIGAIAGVLGGLLGIGGGVITVPCLLYIFHLLDFPQPYIMHMAIATSLAAMIFNMTAATWAHNRRGTVLWDVFKKMLPGLMIGSVLGALIATWLSGVFLEIIFGIFLCALAFIFYRAKPVHVGTYKLPSTPKLSAYTCCIGAFSNILGIGGGSMVVPLLTTFKIPDKKAIGTSAVSTLVTTILGAISYLILGWGRLSSPQTVGFIDLPAFFIIGVVSFFCAPIGARLTHEISSEKIRKIFAIVLVVTGISLMI
ncbi:MAG: sulfite exporter TauE/SafE family protein [Rhabdochlamydiaceae bacterium]